MRFLAFTLFLLSTPQWAECASPFFITIDNQANVAIDNIEVEGLGQIHKNINLTKGSRESIHIRVGSREGNLRISWVNKSGDRDGVTLTPEQLVLVFKDGNEGVFIVLRGKTSVEVVGIRGKQSVVDNHREVSIVELRPEAVKKKPEKDGGRSKSPSGPE